MPDVDAILVGHAHKEIPQRYVTNETTGQQVLLCEPSYWGKRLAVMDFVVEETRSRRGQRWRLVAATSQVLNSNTAAEDPRVARAVHEQHDTVVAYVNSPVGTSTGGALRRARGRRGRADHRLRQLRAGRRGQGRG